MRILIVSDTHGRHGNLQRAVEECGKIDLMIHLGDVEGGEAFINAVADCDKYILKGNNDFYSNLPEEKEFFLNGKKIFITHGHYHWVGIDMDEIKKVGRERGADVVMFGHTHRPYYEEVGGMIVLNPGSISFPRQENRKGSYVIMEMDEQGNITCEQHFLD